MYGGIVYQTNVQFMMPCIPTSLPAGSGQTGLKNERPGGETVPKDGSDDMDGPYCVYFVFRSFQRPPDRKAPMA